MNSKKSIPINSFDISKFNIKPLTRDNLNNQKKNKNICYMTFIYYDQNYYDPNNYYHKFYLKCDDLRLIGYSGIPSNNFKTQENEKYNLTINFDDNNENLKKLKDVLNLIDQYMINNKDLILENFDNDEKNSIKYCTLNKKKYDVDDNVKYITYDKVNIKLPYDHQKKCFKKNFKVYILCADNKARRININNINDLRNYIKRGAIIKPIIKFNYVWIDTRHFNKWGITLLCEQLLIKFKGEDDNNF